MSKRKYIILAIIIAVLAVFTVISIYFSKNGLTTINYQVATTKVSQQIRLIHIGDLHNSEFGENNETLISEIYAQDPDIIFISGDLLNSNEKNTDVAMTLLAELAKKYPVYVSMGNHEIEYQQQFGTDLENLYESTGTVVLDKEYVDVELSGQKIRIGGIYGFCYPDDDLYNKDQEPDQSDFLWEFQDTESFSILLEHLPVAWIECDNLNFWQMDLVLCGHTHGGMIRLPVIGGLYAPDQGLFPGKMSGVYTSEDGERHMILTRGLGTNGWLPRVNNIPEIQVIDIMPSGV